MNTLGMNSNAARAYGVKVRKISRKLAEGLGAGSDSPAGKGGSKGLIASGRDGGVGIFSRRTNRTQSTQYTV
eukprot:6616770-Pyramimonas_sp.AAC.1